MPRITDSFPSIDFNFRYSNEQFWIEGTTKEYMSVQLCGSLIGTAYGICTYGDCTSDIINRFQQVERLAITGIL